MKINRTPNNLKIANEILLMMTDREDEMKTSGGDVLTIRDGELLLYHVACGTDASETVLIDRLESDSMGAGWEAATAADVIEWLETNCE